MKNKIIAMILMVALLCALLPHTLLFASAEEPTSGTCGDNLRWSFDGATETLTISGSGEMYDYENFDSVPWNTFYESVQAVVINDGVTSIGDYAFENFSELSSIKLGRDVKSIGKSAFRSSWKTKDVYISDIAAWCEIDFADEYSNPLDTGNLYINEVKATDLTIPDGVSRIKDFAFFGCWSLSRVRLPDSVTAIGKSAFNGCVNLATMVIPISVTSIGECAFSHCRDLSSVTIPNSVTSIGDYAFNNCENLRSINYVGTEEQWNAYDMNIDDYFVFCATIYYWNPSNDPEKPYAITGTCDDNLTWMLDIPTGELVISGTGAMENWDMYSKTPWGSFYRTIQTVIISDGVKTIGDYAFYGCQTLSEISIPNSVMSIGASAFRYCLELTRASIPDSVTDIGEAAFDACYKLTEIIIPNGVTSIKFFTFADCESLTNVIIPDGVTSIGEYAFADCNALTTITIPNSVTTIGNDNFDTCYNLTDVYFGGTEAEWNAINIGDFNWCLQKATIHYTEPPAPVDPCEGYSDIKSGSWYYSAAAFAIERGLMGSTSTSELRFEPKTNLSRAMVASILYRLCDSPAVTYQGIFTDVKNNKWFTSAIEWAAQNGLASGKGNGKFDPNGDVTRQELAVFMMKTAEYLGKNTSGRNDLTSFADSASVPKWAKTYVQWAVDAGLISGKASGDKTMLAPLDTATRAEFASIIMRFVQNIAENQ